MIDYDMYEEYLGIKGRNLSEVRKHDSAMIMNATFTGSVGYKRVYVLDPEQGWIWTDAKYSRHSRQSIAADSVDYYLQFRPFEHYPVGTYIFVPDDTSDEIGFVEDMPENPFKDGNFGQIFNKGKLWMIVDRNNEREFIRYMILQVDYDIKWICYYKGQKQILHCYGVTRTQSSYTAGTWLSDYSTTLDTITGFWLPDTYAIFKYKLSDYDICDTRYLQLDIRIVISHNKIYPQCWRITKINETEPTGILKFVCKRDEWNEKCDNKELMICDYYDDSGEEVIPPAIISEPSPEKISILWWAILRDHDEHGEKIDPPIIEINDTALVKFLVINQQRYFVAEFSDDNVVSQWYITYSDSNEDATILTEKDKDKLCDLLKITKHSNTAISIKPSKSKTLIGKKFNLTVQDLHGEYKSSITDMEVRAS